jgi:glycosyltransferase involved in cell wall biosynthesis
MSDCPVATIAIPTRDRPKLIKEAIESALAQTTARFELLVVDNSTDASTEETVRAFKDARIRYQRTDACLSVIDCWNLCIQHSRGRYIHILGDDDRVAPDFLRLSLNVLEGHPEIAFTFTHANKTDEDWKPLRLWGYDFPPAGSISGKFYLELTLTHGCCLTLAPTVVMRKSVHDQLGGYRADIVSNTFDFNFYLRVGESFSCYFIDQILVDYRLHRAQLAEKHWRSRSRPTGKIATYLELLALIPRLFRAWPTARDQAFLQQRLEVLTRGLAELLHRPFPDL